MITLSNHSGQVEEGRNSARTHIGSRLLVLVGLGAMVFTVLSCLPGCGSDSTPGGSVKGKNAKPAARAEGVKPQVPSTLLMDQAGTVPGKMKKQPDSQRMEVFPGVTREELEARLAESRKNHAAMRPEVLPGITQEQLDARLAQSRKNHLAMRQEVLPGITQEQLGAKLAESRKMHDPKEMRLPAGGTPK